MAALLQRMFGDQVADGIRAPFNLGDTEVILPLFVAADIPEARLTTMDGTARFPSIEAWVHTDIKGWTLADLIDDAQYETLQQKAQRKLKHFAQEDGTVIFRAPAHIVTVAKL